MCLMFIKNIFSSVKRRISMAILRAKKEPSNPLETEYFTDEGISSELKKEFIVYSRKKQKTEKRRRRPGGTFAIKFVNCWNMNVHKRTFERL